ncbi:MAG: CoA transferase [Chloroflexi bacterium]|nr:CoA transferase [Chloroflexota bacterium]
MPGPLAGVRVVDFTWAWAGPYGAMLLRLLGADVVKIESRTRMDQARIGSIVLGQAKGNYNQQPMFTELNLGKRSIAMNLKAPGAAQVVKDLYAISDAVMDNFRPGTLDKLGLGYDVMTAIRPDHILLSASALGATGPERSYGGYAPTFAALAGLVALAGQPGAEPMLIGGTVDLRVGTAAALALLAALHRRDRTGQGVFIDHSARESVAMLIGDALLAAQMRPPADPTDEPERLGNGHRAFAPHGLYPCAGDDAAVAIVCRDDAAWAALLAISGLPLGDDPRFATGLSRWKHRADLDAALGAWTRTQEAAPLAARLREAGVPASVSRSGADLYDWPQFRARGGPVAVEAEEAGRRLIVPPPWRMSRTPAAIPGPAPSLGADNHSALRELLGYDAARIAALEESGALE